MTHRRSASYLSQQGITLVLLAGASLPLAAQIPHLPKAPAQPAPHWAQLTSETLLGSKKIKRRFPVQRKQSENKSEQEREREAEENGGKTGYEQAYEQWKKARFGEGPVDWSIYERARVQRDRLPAGIAKPTANGKGQNGISVLAASGNAGEIVIDPIPTDTDGKWKFAGPTNLQPPYQLYFGPSVVSGRVNGVAFDPNNTRVYYLASALGGIWKTTDSGKTWKPLTDFIPTLATTCVVVDPIDSNIIYVGTGDYDGGDGPGIGLLKSTDGGATWQRNANFSNFAFRHISIYVDPVTKARTLYAVQGFAAIKSTDGGATWSVIRTTVGKASNIQFSADRATMYVSSDVYRDYSVFPPIEYPGDVYVSNNGGSTWTQILNEQYGRIDIAASKTDPTVAYILSEEDQKVYKVTERGAATRSISSSLSASNFVQTGYNFYLETSLDSDNSDVVYVGMLDIFMSPGGGDNWQSIANAFSEDALIHTDQHTLTFSPKNPGLALVGNDGGAYRMQVSPKEGLAEFTSLNGQLGITQFYSLAVHPTSKDIMLGGTQDNATPFASGNVNRWTNPGNGDGGYAHINPLLPAQQYLTSQFFGAVNRTDDSWRTSYDITPDNLDGPVLFIHPWAIDANTPNNLYVSSLNVLRYKPDDGDAGTWEEMDNDLVPESVTHPGDLSRGWNTTLTMDWSGVTPTSAIAVSALDVGRVYIGTTSGQLYMSVDDEFIRLDSLLTRISLTNYVPVPFFRPGYIASIRPSLIKNGRVYITVSPGILYRIDLAGTDDLTGQQIISVTRLNGTGNNRLPSVFINDVVLPPYEDEQTIYVATDIGVFQTTDGGINWSNITAPLGLPNVRVSRLEFNSSTGLLSAATYGRGIWRLETGNTVAFKLNCILDTFRGNKNNLTARVDVLDASGRVTELRRQRLTSSGYFIARMSTKGTRDILVTIPRFLKKRVRSVNFGSDIVYSTGQMLNGDVDGDNAVTNADITAIKQSMGRYSTGTVDLDGDGQVSSRDLAIAVKNLGRRGDN